MNNWRVYIVRCSDGTLYTGVSNDVERRVQDHNTGVHGAKYTRKHRPVSLLAMSGPMTQGEALRLEHKVKKIPRLDKVAFLLDATGWKLQ